LAPDHGPGIQAVKIIGVSSIDLWQAMKTPLCASGRRGQKRTRKRRMEKRESHLQMKRLLIALLIATPIMMMAAASAWEIVLRAALEPVCGDQVLSEQKSPNGVLILSVYRSNCGATTDYAMGLSIRRAGDEFDPSPKNATLILGGNILVTALWIDDENIQIDVPKGADTFRSERQWNGVTIRYVAH